MAKNGGNNMWGMMGYVDAPYSYKYINLYNAMFSPSTVHCTNTYLVGFFANYLIEKAFSVFEFEIPDNWDRDYFLYTLFLGGYTCQLNTKSFGMICQECTLSGYNVYYRPTEAFVTNELLRINKGLQIGQECELIRLQPNYKGILDIVSYVADNMALCAEACGVNVINSKLSFLLTTDDKAAAESYKKMYDNYASGQPAVVVGGKDLFGMDAKPKLVFFNNDVAGSYIIDKLQTALRQWELTFDNYVGIPNNPITKKERVVITEVESNNIETRVLSDIWLETLQYTIEKTNKLFGSKISVKYRYEQKDITGGVADGATVGVNTGNVSGQSRNI